MFSSTTFTIIYFKKIFQAKKIQNLYVYELEMPFINNYIFIYLFFIYFYFYYRIFYKNKRRLVIAIIVSYNLNLKCKRVKDKTLKLNNFDN